MNRLIDFIAGVTFLMAGFALLGITWYIWEPSGVQALVTRLKKAWTEDPDPMQGIVLLIGVLAILICFLFFKAVVNG